MSNLRNYSRLVKFEHTVFALPFALIGFFLALQNENSELNFKLLGLVLLCMVFARNAAMAFNRYIDRQFDKLNPRTALREIPAGILKARPVLLFVAVNSVLFILTAWYINQLCFYLSPIALFIILFYSYTKRFTFLCHFILSLGLAIAPVGAYLAVTGVFDWPPVLLGTAVFFWVSGFDIIYALQDKEFDTGLKLKSIPALFGKSRALMVAKAIHLLSACFIIAVAVKISGNWLHWTGAFIFITLLIYQHTLIKPGDLSRVNLAFFTMNGIASIIYGASVITALYI
jgi:4-hydroxybenzoate polyprenyltransferase